MLSMSCFELHSFCSTPRLLSKCTNCLRVFDYDDCGVCVRKNMKRSNIGGPQKEKFFELY